MGSMTRLARCGAAYHPINSCRACRSGYERERYNARIAEIVALNDRIVALNERIGELESILAGKRPRCPSCHVRTRVIPLPVSDALGPYYSGQQSLVSWLRKAAHWFDREANERYTASEFVDWIKPDLSEQVA